MKRPRLGIFNQRHNVEVKPSEENNKTRHRASDKYHFYVFDRKAIFDAETLKRYSRCIQRVRVTGPIREVYCGPTLVSSFRGSLDKIGHVDGGVTVKRSKVTEAFGSIKPRWASDEDYEKWLTSFPGVPLPKQAEDLDWFLCFGSDDPNQSLKMEIVKPRSPTELGRYEIEFTYFPSFDVFPEKKE